jgi:hypothetical protein
MRLGVFYQPLHSVQHICLGWKPLRISTIVRQDHDILRFELPMLCEMLRGRGTRIYAKRVNLLIKN